MQLTCCAVAVVSGVMTSEAVHALFAESRKLFEPILGQPQDSDIVRIHRVIAPILLDIPYDKTNGGKDNLVGIIMAKDNVGVAKKDWKPPPGCKPVLSWNGKQGKCKRSNTRATGMNKFARAA